MWGLWLLTGDTSSFRNGVLEYFDTWSLLAAYTSNCAISCAIAERNDASIFGLPHTLGSNPGRVVLDVSVQAVEMC